MIDISRERVITFTEAAGHLPRRRMGRRPHVATLYRWTQRGLRGVRLESIQIGGSLCTSVEAMQRFFNRLGGGDESPAASSPSADRAKAVSQAEQVCKAAGI